MSQRVLLALIGDNPASALVAARAINPDRLVLVHTQRTRALAGVVAEQIGDNPATALIELTNEGGIDGHANRIKSSISLSDTDHVYVDITGGTKPMSLGAWNAFADLPHTRLHGIYLDQQAYRLLDARNGQPVQLAEPTPEIRIDEMLSWYQARVMRPQTRWRGRLSDIPRKMKVRAPIGHLLLQQLSQSNQSFNARLIGFKQLTQLDPRLQLPPGLWFKQSRLICEDEEYLAKNGWLEELCLVAVSNALDQPQTVLAAHGLHVRLERGQDEMDLVLVRGSRVVVIEAKARSSSAGAGADLQKRINKAQRFFGPHARVIFVHPSWGNTPPPDLSALAGKGVDLIGDDLDELGKVTAQALGLDTRSATAMVTEGNTP